MEPLEIRIEHQLFNVDLNKPLDISIPLRSGNVNPNKFADCQYWIRCEPQQAGALSIDIRKSQKNM